VLSWGPSDTPLEVELAIVIGDINQLSDVILTAEALRDGCFASSFEQAISDRQQQLNDALLPNNARYSGHLPVLDTGDQSVARVYYMSVLAVLASERIGLPYASCSTNRVWITGGGENATTNSFFWDNAFLSTTLAMLDPVTLKVQLT
jgi:hypothetical protein